MKLASDRFYRGNVTKRLTLFAGTDSERSYDTTYTRFSYESAGKLYNVDVRDSDGDRTYHVNCGFATEPSKYHRAIEAHFGL